MTTAIVVGLSSISAVLISAVPVLLKYIYGRRDALTISIRHKGREVKLSAENVTDAERIVDIWLAGRGKKHGLSRYEGDEGEGSE